MAKTRKIDSSCTRFAFAREDHGRIGVLYQPAGPGSDNWFTLSPLSYGDFGATIESVSDEPIGSGRAPLKGSPVRKTVNCSFEISLRQRNVQRLFPGFFYTLAHEAGTTDAFYRTTGTTDTELTSITATTFVGRNFTANNGWGVPAGGSLLVVGQGFSEPNNNGLHVVTGVSATALTTTGLVTEPGGGDNNSEVVICGMRYASGANAAYNASEATITFTLDGLHEGDFSERVEGEFIYLGTDVIGQFFDGVGGLMEGFARIKEINTGNIVCDLTTFLPRARSAAGKADIFIPTRSFYDTTDCGDDTRTTYQFERVLGKSDDTNRYDQSQVVEGAVANELTFNIPSGDRVTVGMSFMCTDSERRTGKTGPPLSEGKLIKEDIGPIFNTSYDIRELAIYLPTDKSTTAHLARRVIGYVTECTLTLNNNATAIEAIGVFGAADVNAGIFNVTGSVTALFTDVAAINAVEENADAGFLLIATRQNSGFVLDIPLLTLSAANLSLENNSPVTIALDGTANRNEHGYSVMLNFFDYLPNNASETAGNFDPNRVIQ